MNPETTADSGVQDVIRRFEAKGKPEMENWVRDIGARAARWIAADAIGELESEAVRKRLLHNTCSV